MLTNNRPRLNDNSAPAHLAPVEQELWRKLKRSFAIDDAASEEILMQALEARQRAREARLVLKKCGLTYEDHHGNVKSRPEIQIERSSHASFLSAMRLLRLDISGELKDRDR
jgi:hypothetical protein